MRMLQTQNSCSESFILWVSSVFTEQFRIGVRNSVWQKTKGTRKNSQQRRIREQREIKNRECSSSEPFGILSKTGIWKQFAGKHSGLRITVSETIKFSRVCEDASFWYRVSAGMKYKTKLDEDDGFGQIIPWCREYTLSRVDPQSRAYAAIPEGTIVGPVIEVHIVEVLDNFGLEIGIPSPNNPRRTSYVLISRWKSRFVDELHMPNARHTLTSAELLSEHENAKESELCLAQSKTSSGKLVAASVASRSSTRKLDADPISVSASAVHLYTKRTIHTTERKWTSIPANSSYGGGSLSIAISKNGYKIGASLWSRRTTIWCSSSLGHDKAETAKNVRKTRRTRFLRRRLASTFSWRKLQDKIRVLRGFQKFLGLLTSNSRTLWCSNNCACFDGAQFNSLQLERVCVSQGSSFSIHSILENGLMAGRGGTTDHLLHTSQPIRVKFRWRSA